MNSAEELARKMRNDIIDSGIRVEEAIRILDFLKSDILEAMQDFSCGQIPRWSRRERKKAAAK